jgi:uncharacterized membrane protein YphA (DoxX/SURF4 family)
MSRPIFLIVAGAIFLVSGFFTTWFSFIPAAICFVWAGAVYWRGRQVGKERERKGPEEGPTELMGRQEIEKRK